MAEYNRIARKCKGEYGCIETAFDKLPDIQIPPEEVPAGSDIAAMTGPQGPVSADATPAAVHLPAVQQLSAPTRIPPGSLFGASLQLTEWAPGKVTVAVQYSNRGPVHLRLGPVELEMKCRDGSRGRVFAGGSDWVAPGETVSLSQSGEGVIYGQSCPDGIESYHPTGLVRHLQAGIGSYDDQVAVCADGRRLPVALTMADRAGRHFDFWAEGGRRVEATAADYDARRELARLCGGVAVGGARAAFIAEGEAYLSRDFLTYMQAWTSACADKPASCAKDYADWTATQPRKAGRARRLSR